MSDVVIEKQDCYTKELKVLFVEDDEMLLNIGSSLFSRFFDTIYPFDNAISALSFYESNFQNIDLIITDIMMPVVSGIEFIGEVKKMNENQRVVIYSACTDEETLNKIDGLQIDAFIRKPPRKDEMEVCFNKIAKELHDARAVSR